MTGGAGEDVFAQYLHGADEPKSTGYIIVNDYNPAEDVIRLAAPSDSTLELADIRADISVVVWADGTGADIFYQGVLHAKVPGGQTLTAAQIDIGRIIS